jgi:hypothetical protein
MGLTMQFQLEDNEKKKDEIETSFESTIKQSMTKNMKVNKLFNQKIVDSYSENNGEIVHGRGRQKIIIL